MLPRLSVILISILFFFILLFGFIKLAGPIPFDVNSVATTKTDNFSVTGEGTSTQKPDTAMVNVGVSANGATVKVAQDQINSNINQVTQAIKNLGIDTSDIQTDNYNINPQYDFTNGQKITGYSASTNLAIKVTDITKVNSIIDAATAGGANTVSGVQFTVADQQKAEDEARQIAVAQAKQKAQDAAKIAGFKLGRIINYSEDFGDQVPQPLPLAAPSVVKDATTQVQLGSAQIKVTVTLSYEIL